MTHAVHLRPDGIVQAGETRTACGLRLYPLDDVNDSAVVSFNGFSSRRLDATVHGTLTTCVRCLAGTKVWAAAHLFQSPERKAP